VNREPGESRTNRTVGASLLLCAVLLLNFLTGFIPVESLGTNLEPFLATSVIQLLVFAMPTLIYLKIRFPLKRLRRLRFRMPKNRHIVLMFSSFCVIIFANALINYAMAYIFPDSFSGTSSVTDAFNVSGLFGGLYGVLAFAIVPAIVEEVLFRSVICSEFECAGVGCAVFFSSLTFAMSHFSFVRFPVYFVCGIVLALVFYATRSVIASMIVHCASNTVSIFIEEYLYKIVNRQGVVLFLFLISVLLIASLIFLFSEVQRSYTYYGEMNEKADYLVPKRNRVSFVEVVLSPAFLILCVLYIVASAVS